MQTRLGTQSAVAVGMLGCAYILLEGFLFTARRSGRQGATESPGGRRLS